MLDGLFVDLDPDADPPGTGSTPSVNSRGFLSRSVAIGFFVVSHSSKTGRGKSIQGWLLVIEAISCTTAGSAKTVPKTWGWKSTWKASAMMATRRDW